MYKRTDNNFHSRPVTLTATDGRFADRFREMMQIVDFCNDDEKYRLYRALKSAWAWGYPPKARKRKEGDV